MTNYICSSCGEPSSSWYGKCPACGQWNTLGKAEVDSTSAKKKGKATPAKLATFKNVASIKSSKLETGIYEIDRVLAGGFSPGQVALLAGEPGVGKSTLLLKGLSKLKVLYASGEESTDQVADRARRVGINLDNFLFTDESQVESIIEAAKDNIKKFQIIVIDSVQTIHSGDVLSAAGSVSQIRSCVDLLSDFVKEYQKTLVIVGHVNKAGDIAGPKTLEHLVDSVFYLEGDKNSSYRVLRARKNRFGTTDEVGLFEMHESGLQPVKNPTAFIDYDRSPQPGRAITATIEGSRALFFEIQCLVSPTNFALPRRVVSGIDFNRLQLILAALKKHLYLSLDNSDVFVSVVGGLSIKSPAADLGIAMSIISSAKNKAVPTSTLFFGEIGLLGEIRHIYKEEQIEKEAKRFGFSKIYSASKTATLRDIGRLF